MNVNYIVHGKILKKLKIMCLTLIIYKILLQKMVTD